MLRPLSRLLAGLALLASGAAAAQPFATDAAWRGAVPDVERSAAAWGDLDADGVADLAVAGWTPAGRRGTVLRGPAPSAAATLPAVDLGSVAWGDLDGDGRDDLALIGARDDAQSVLVGEVYRSTGAGLVRDDAASAVLPDLYGGALAWGDLDGDGDPDLIVTGAADAWQTDLRGLVFRNDGGALTLDAANSAALPDVVGAGLALADLDGDGDLDLVVTGFDAAFAPVGMALRNDGGTLVADGGWSAAVPDVGAGAVGAGDLDGDGDPDLVVTGGRVAPDGSLVLVGDVLRNDGGALARDAARSAAVPDVFFSAVALADADGDGDADLAVSGATATSTASALLWGGASRLTVSGVAVPSVFDAALAWADADADGDLDLLVTGSGPTGGVGVLLANLRPPPGPPIADAGPDQRRTCVGPGATSFTLDGSRSSDPEGAPLTYSWTGPFPEGGGTVGGVGPTVSLPSGAHVVTLTATDPGGLTDTDAVTLEVLDGVLPTIARTSPATDTVLRFSGPYPDPGATASDACDGPLTPVATGLVDTSLPGVYTLTYTATDLAGNAVQTTRSVTVEDVDAPLLSPYAALAGRNMQGNKHGLITGDLHANGDLQFRKGLRPRDGGPSRVVGSLTSSVEVRVDDRNTVEGDITARRLDIDRRAVVTGTVTRAAVPEVPLPTVTVDASGGADVGVGENETLVLPPGTYGEVTVKKDAVLVLGSGEYIFEELDVDDRARVDVVFTTGPTRIDVEEDVDLGKDAVLAPFPLGEADARFLTVRVAGGDVDADDRARIAAQIIAPNGRVRLQGNVRMVGLMVAEDVQIKEGSVLEYLSGGPGTSPVAEPPPDATPAEALPAAARPEAPALAAAYPNPARADATVPFELPAAADVRLTVHDALGREVAVLADGPTAAGRHSPRLDGASLPAGVYLVRLVADGTLADAGRLTLVR